MKTKWTAVRALCLALLVGVGAAAQTRPASSAEQENEQLKFVLVLTRHGVRSPTAKTDKLNAYSAQPWPQWNVPPGHLTERGGQLMVLFGGYYREYFAQQRLLHRTGCGDTSRISFLADSDQRTVATGRALAAGLLPGCSVMVQALPSGTPDPLFHSLASGVGRPNHDLAAAALSGRIGDNPAALVDAYNAPLQDMEKILASCNPGAHCHPIQKPLLQVPSSVVPGKGDHLVDLQGPLSIASTVSEDFLLEYTDGMPLNQVGWGQVDASKLNELITLHTAHSDLLQHTPYLAGVLASNLMSHILATMQQSIDQKSIAGAVGQPGDKVVFLVGHDTNIATVAGLLGLSWISDGRLNDTPPGGALVFEVWGPPNSQIYEVRTYYVSQTLDEMRNLTPLTLDKPPLRANVFVPGCSTADKDYPCPWSRFTQQVKRAINPAFVQ